MYLILSGRAYAIWTEWHHPHELKVSDMKKILRTMTPQEKKAANARARQLVQCGKLVEEASESKSER